MEKMKLKKIGAQRIAEGYPMIVDLDILDRQRPNDGETVELTDETGRFLATAYLGKENKAAGWVISRKKNQTLSEEFFDSLFKKAKKYRKPYFSDSSTTAFRLFNGEGDGLGGLVVDYYAEYAVFHWYNKGLYMHRHHIYDAFQNNFPMIKGIYEKKRYPSAQKSDMSDFVRGEKAPSPLVISENGIYFDVHLDDGYMTGLFLDQRLVRRALMEKYSAGKTVLNLFSYTGAFSVAAAMGGAIKTISVDVANRSQKRTEEQFAVNGLETTPHEIRVMDVFSYVQYALRHKLKFDVIVSDPPTFARTKKRTFSVEEDYSELIDQYIDITKENGVLILSANTWKISRDEFRETITKAFESKGQAFKILEEFGVPEDHPVQDNYPEGDYLKVFIVQKEN